ncbi:MAG: hypothetical protein LBT53_10270 [Puniceicoccales bacterium]|jgi:hypothetical protein|nr:hypothetical protein [Puniceicoccales bacterium]
MRHTTLASGSRLEVKSKTPVEQTNLKLMKKHTHPKTHRPRRGASDSSGGTPPTPTGAPQIGGLQELAPSLLVGVGKIAPPLTIGKKSPAAAWQSAPAAFAAPPAGTPSGGVSAPQIPLRFGVSTPPRTPAISAPSTVPVLPAHSPAAPAYFAKPQPAPVVLGNAGGILPAALPPASPADSGGTSPPEPPRRRRFFFMRRRPAGAASRRRIVILEEDNHGLLIFCLLLLIMGGAFAAWYFLFKEDEPLIANTPATVEVATPVEEEKDVPLPPITDPPETDDTPRFYDHGATLEIPGVCEPEEKMPPSPPPPPPPRRKPDGPPKPIKLIRKTVDHVTSNHGDVPLARTVDTMVVYTTELLGRFGGNHRAMLAHIDSVIDYTNRRYAERKVRSRLRLVGLIESTWQGPAENAVKIGLGTLMSNRVPIHRYSVHKLRSQVGADTVTFIFRFGKRGGGGLASVMGSWAAMDYPVGAIYSHEMRHNAGWNHGDKGNWTMIDRNAPKMASWQPRRMNTNRLFVQYMGTGDEFDVSPEEKEAQIKAEKARSEAAKEAAKEAIKAARARNSTNK